MKAPSKRFNKPSRWIHERGAGPTSLDTELGELFRALPPVAPLAPAILAAVGRRVARQPDATARRSLRYLPLAFAVLAATAGAVAQWAHPVAWRLQQTYVAPPVPANTHPTRAPLLGARPTNGTPITPAAPTAILAPEAMPAPEAIRARELARAPSLAPRAIKRAAAAAALAKPEPAAVRAPSQLALETEALQPALAKLRREHDAKAALRLLDDYQARFPHGAMATEASMARIDALLLLGRRADALGLLAVMPLDRMGRRAELELVRAELYAEHDCRRAVTDFNAVLAGAAPAGLMERALYGRAGCSLRLGNTAAARADLTAYLERYPAGRFVGQVRAAGGRLPTKLSARR